MREKVEIVGVKIDNVNMAEAVGVLTEALDRDSCSMVFTPNSEILLDAVKDREFEAVLNSGQLVVPDGIGVVIASKFYGTPLKERVAGFDLVMAFMQTANSRGSNIYLLGGKEGVAEEAAIKLMEKFGNLNIVGTRNGYFRSEEEEKIIEEINSKNTDILLVALGAPKQEKFIYNYRERLKAKVAIGVGGTLDGLAGRVKRAPEFYQKAGLEWFYRLMKQPSRFMRIMKLPKFVVLAFLDAKFK